MTDQTLINIVFGAICSSGGWFLKTMWGSLKELQSADKSLAEKVQSIEVLVAGQYIKRDDFDRFAEAMFNKLDKISDKLDNKADKT